MTDYIEFNPLENPAPTHIGSVMVPGGEWVEVPGFDNAHTLRVMHEGPVDERLRLLLERPGKITWHPDVPMRWFATMIDGDPQDHSGGDGLKATFGDEPEGHSHSGPGPCPACAP